MANGYWIYEAGRMIKFAAHITANANNEKANQHWETAAKAIFTARNLNTTRQQNAMAKQAFQAMMESLYICRDQYNEAGDDAKMVQCLQAINIVRGCYKRFVLRNEKDSGRIRY